MKVSEVMNTTLCITHPEATVGEAATLMGERKIGSVLICDQDRLVGILTERDIVRALSSDYEASQRPVAEWMSKDPTAAAPTTDVRDALRMMMEGGFRHLPVKEGEQVVGMVSIRDVAEHLSG